MEYETVDTYVPEEDPVSSDPDSSEPDPDPDPESEPEPEPDLVPRGYYNWDAK